MKALSGSLNSGFHVQAGLGLNSPSVGWPDDNGRIILTGRKKDMLIRGKFNLYPGLYEPAIAALPGVDEAAIVGVPDPGTGDEEVVLAVTGTADPARLRRDLPAVIDHDALPDRVLVLDALPRSGRTRKLDRDRLRDLAARHRGTPG